MRWRSPMGAASPSETFSALGAGGRTFKSCRPDQAPIDCEAVSTKNLQADRFENVRANYPDDFVLSRRIVALNFKDSYPSTETSGRTTPRFWRVWRWVRHHGITPRV